MAASDESDTVQVDEERQIPEWAQGTKLRNVERDVLIPKIMREKTKILCKEFVDEFKECARGRTVSMLWKCMEQNNAMKNCIAKHYQDPELFEECKEIYLKQRDDFQQDWVKTGQSKLPDKKKSTFNF